MPNTTNFNWPTPADTDLVKDGAAAIRNLGNGIDTSLIDLKGGTTGQILSKASNADMDFTFITPNVGDITEVQAGTGISVASGTGPVPVVTNTVATTFDAAGDLVYGTGADTFTKLSLGTAGQVLKVNSGATAPEWGSATPSYTWTAFTPSINAFTIGNGTVNARYVQIDKVVIGYVVATLGSTSSVTGNMYFTLPVARASSAEGTPAIAHTDTSGGLVGQIGAVASTLMALRVGKADGTYLTGAQTSGTVPATWATGNSFAWNFTYEAA